MCCQRSRGEDRRIRQSHGHARAPNDTNRVKEGKRKDEVKEGRRAKKANFGGSTSRLLTSFIFSQGVRLDGGRLNVVVPSYSLGPKKMVMIMIVAVVPYIGDTFCMAVGA